MAYIVAIDGPAGSGKGTVTELVAKKLGLVNIGSGSAYRCVALETINKGIDLKEKEKIINLLDEIEIEFKMENSKDIVYLNGKDVTSRIREKDVAKIVSFVSSIKEVRFKLNEIFKKCAKSKNVIMEGRDIGTYVFPNAEVKIYLDAKPEERARRRFKQNQEEGITGMTYEEILENVKQRDFNDSHREIAPLKKADDAILVDSTELTIEQATPTEPTIPEVNTVYAPGKTLADVELPTITEGTLDWKDGTELVGDVANQKEFTAIFTPNDTNYAAKEVTIKVVPDTD